MGGLDNVDVIGNDRQPASADPVLVHHFYSFLVVIAVKDGGHSLE